MLRVCFNIIPLNSGFLFYFLSDWRQEALTQQSGDQFNSDTAPVATSVQTNELSPGRHRKWRGLAVLVIQMVFTFLYVGMEVAFGTFLTTFAVKSKLGGLKVSSCFPV